MKPEYKKGESKIESNDTHDDTSSSEQERSET